MKKSLAIMRCVSGKTGYYSETEVQEALIRSQISFARPAVNYYRCPDCDEYHLTSQGAPHPLLEETEIQQRIKRERLAREWEGRLR